MGGRILVVDDVATNRILLKAKLASGCYEVLQAASGREALDLARSARPDLILLDLAMPDMDGLEVLAALKADRATAPIPVVFVTAHADRRARLAALRAGAEDYLTKPVDDAELSARMRALLRTRLLAEELEMRAGTRAALGFGEAQAEVSWSGAAAAAPPARVALIAADGATANAWRRALAPHLPHRLDVMGRAGALRLAGGEGGPEPDAAELPEVFVISVDLAGPGDGLGLLSELRARPATRHAAILVALSEASRPAGPMALDLGASDLIVPPGEPEEMALRIAAQLRRARANEAMRRRLHEGLQMAMTDPLTGLPNRRYALSHAARAGERAARRGTGLAVLLLDLDRFKAVNDAHGHAAGDAVLRAVAGRLKGALRAVDLLARIGGEEFLAVLPEVSPGEALDAAERLRQAVGAAPVPLPGGGSVVQTVSVGVACATAHDAADSPGKGDPDTPAEGAGRREAHAGTAPDMDSLMRRADAALYAAKAAGRDRVHDASRKGEAGVAAA